MVIRKQKLSEDYRNVHAINFLSSVASVFSVV